MKLLFFLLLTIYAEDQPPTEGAPPPSEDKIDQKDCARLKELGEDNDILRDLVSKRLDLTFSLIKYYTIKEEEQEAQSTKVKEASDQIKNKDDDAKWMSLLKESPTDSPTDSNSDFPFDGKPKDDSDTHLIIQNFDKMIFNKLNSKYTAKIITEQDDKYEEARGEQIEAIMDIWKDLVKKCEAEPSCTLSNNTIFESPDIKAIVDFLESLKPKDTTPETTETTNPPSEDKRYVRANTNPSEGTNDYALCEFSIHGINREEETDFDENYKFQIICPKDHEKACTKYKGERESFSGSIKIERSTEEEFSVTIYLSKKTDSGTYNIVKNIESSSCLIEQKEGTAPDPSQMQSQPGAAPTNQMNLPQRANLPVGIFNA